MAESANFKSLFNNNADNVKFYACEQGDSLKNACSSLYKQSYFVFKKNGTAIVSYGEGEKKAKWTESKNGVNVKEPDGNFEYTFSEGKYLSYVEEETGDLIAFKLAK